MYNCLVAQGNAFVLVKDSAGNQADLNTRCRCDWLHEERRARASVVGAVSGALRTVQTGFARSYALTMFGGAILLVAFLVLVRL